MLRLAAPRGGAHWLRAALCSSAAHIGSETGAALSHSVCEPTAVPVEITRWHAAALVSICRPMEFRGRGFAESAHQAEEQAPDTPFYTRAMELIEHVDEAAERSGQAAEESEELRGKLEEAAECLEIALSEASQDARVLFALARLHDRYELRGGPADRGLGFLHQAVDAGSAEAQYELACRIRSQEDEAGPNEGRSQHLLEKAAAQGHSEAMFLLGAADYQAREDSAASKSAARWFKQAADLGHVPAATIYGILLLKGLAKDETQPDGAASKLEAGRYLKYAAERGEAVATEWLKGIDNKAADRGQKL